MMIIMRMQSMLTVGVYSGWHMKQMATLKVIYMLGYVSKLQNQLTREM